MLVEVELTFLLKAHCVIVVKLITADQDVQRHDISVEFL